MQDFEAQVALLLSRQRGGSEDSRHSFRLGRPESVQRPARVVGEPPPEA